jgi:hypothetical protein
VTDLYHSHLFEERGSHTPPRGALSFCKNKEHTLGVKAFQKEKETCTRKCTERKNGLGVCMQSFVLTAPIGDDICVCACTWIAVKCRRIGWKKTYLVSDVFQEEL